MSTVRTQTFFERPAYSGAPLLVYTCPAGVVSVLETIGISIGHAITVLAEVTLVDGLVLWAASPLPSAFDVTYTGVWRGRYVLAPGEQLFIGTNGFTTADFYAAGFTLTLP